VPFLYASCSCDLVVVCVLLVTVQQYSSVTLGVYRALSGAVKRVLVATSAGTVRMFPWTCALQGAA
jgi:hypothetical protein